MESRRKRIAILGAQISEVYQRDFVEGCMEYFFPDNYDICVFATHNKVADTDLRSVGEANIFSACNFSSFDGVIVLADTILIPGAVKEIENRLRDEFDGPVIFFEKQSDYFPYIMFDHYGPIYRSVEHLIKEHGYKDIAFLTGKEYHPTSKLRLEAFKKCMSDNNLAIGDNRILYGDFWYTGGEVAVDSLLQYGKLPEAIMCANDYMAIGVGMALDRKGYKVPQDVAVMGYDSVEEGRESPSPITSLKIPSRQLGKHVSKCLEILMNGGSKEDFPEFMCVDEMFVGNSCGCYFEPTIKYGNRETWKTEKADGSFLASQNRILENMLSNPSFQSVMDTVQTYTFQIRDFDSFDICIDSYWADGFTYDDDKALRKGYSDKMLHVLSCGRAGEGADKLSYDEFFDRSQMLSKLDEEDRAPRCFVFNPLYFDDIGFGYSVIGLDNNLLRADETYLLWLKSVMFGFEALRKIEILKKKQFVPEEVVNTDVLTGLFNYNGLLAHSTAMVERGIQVHSYIGMIALDINGLAEINSSHGRKAGDDAILELAKILVDSSDEGSVCCRLGNDEFVVSQLVSDAAELEDVEAAIKKALVDNEKTRGYEISVSSGCVTKRVNIMSDLEDLVNEAVSAKNRDKVKRLKAINGDTLTPEELAIAVKVKALLDENRFNYHFQPIVDAKTGDIFAYEALMRPDIDPYIAPNVVVDYADHIGRIADVEECTFTNVISIFEANIDKFGGKKVFINSLPGVKIKGNNRNVVFDKLQQHKGQFVIELTEQREADDATLTDMKELFRKCGINIAVDDYGTGYSNVVNIMRYEPNFVKVDRFLVSGIENNQQSQHFVNDIVRFAHDNNIFVIAEGVENSDELKTCINLGVDYIQGYYTARPNAAIISSIAEDKKHEIETARAQ